jgi:hypothetical protein
MKIFSLILAMLVLGLPAEAASTVEFEGPYAVSVSADGLELTITGTYAWALPQQVNVALIEAPQIRVVRLESPGGYVKAAMQVVEMIRARHLDTYVPRICASACTIAFLAGQHRSIAATARLGFHQAHGPGSTSEQNDFVLRAAYQPFGLPPVFLEHVMRTPPRELWFPDAAELQNAHVITAIMPPVLP